MARRVRAPEATRIDVGRGDWILVKKRLTAGEQRRIFDRMVKSMSTDGKIQIDPMQVGHSQAVEYLLDWGTFLDSHEKPIVIAGKSRQEVSDALESIDHDDYGDIVKAIQSHVEAMDAERDAEKNAQNGGTESSAISPSAA